MCLIIHAPQGVKIPEEHLKSALEKNPDGWGIVIPIKGGKVKIIKSTSQNMDSILEKIEGVSGAWSIHFRMRTHGSLGIENIHPHRVISEDDGFSPIWMMHNGIIRGTGAKPQEGESDTYLYIKNFLRPLLLASSQPHKMLEIPQFLEMLGNHVGRNNKLLLTGDGMRNVIVNEEAWIKQDSGAFYSNNYGWDRPIKTYYANYTHKFPGFVGTGAIIKPSTEPIPLVRPATISKKNGSDSAVELGASGNEFIKSVIRQTGQITDDLLELVETPETFKELVKEFKDEVIEYLIECDIFNDENVLLHGLGVAMGINDWSELFHDGDPTESDNTSVTQVQNAN